MTEVKARTPEEWANFINEMDQDLFATAIINIKFWEWVKNPDSAENKKTKELLLKKFNIEDTPLFNLMLAYHAGAEAGLDIAKTIITK